MGSTDGRGWGLSNKVELWKGPFRGGRRTSAQMGFMREKVETALGSAPEVPLLRQYGCMIVGTTEHATTSKTDRWAE
jgi:hypothetical protein